MSVKILSPRTTDEWLEMRRDNIGASVVGALLGVHAYATGYSLWALKAGRIIEDVEETPPLRRGRLLEPVAVQLLREERPQWHITPNSIPGGKYFVDPSIKLAATPDVFVRDEADRLGVVQLKSVEPSIFRRDWYDDDGEVAPPLWIVVQAVTEAYLVGAEWAAVAAMTVSFGVELHIVPVPLHAGIVDRIKTEVATFWKLVESGAAPDPDYARDCAMIARIFPRDDGSEIDLSGDNEFPMLVDQLVDARGEKKIASAREDEAKAGILAKMGEASYARLADGRRVSCKLQQRAGYSVAASEFRVTRILNR